jgi:hypothetical protein
MMNIMKMINLPGIATFLMGILMVTGTMAQKQEPELIFPAPFAFAIDDMGWIKGNNEGYGEHIGPYRGGVDKKFDVNDYKAIVEVGKAVGVRIQGVFILSEMDRLDILDDYPTTTWKRDQWDNSENIGDEQLEIMDYVQDQAAYLEFGLHGVGHEYWPEDGVRKRAEWYNTEDNHPWPEDTLRKHLEAFERIMGQYGLSEANGHSFPEAFVPCAYSFYWNPEGDYSLGKLLNERGVKYANTLFHYVSELNPPQGPNAGGIDHGVLTVNRINYGNPWYELSSLPTVPVAEQESDIIETHFPNWLAQDDFLQQQVTRDYIEYYNMVQQQENRYVAKNTEQFSSQWLYKKYSEISREKPGRYEIDNTGMPDQVYEHNLLGNLVVKVTLGENEHIRVAEVNGEPVAAYYEEAGFGFIYLPPLEQKKYELTYKTGSATAMPHVYHSGTYNVYRFEPGRKSTQMRVRVYGDQKLEIRQVREPVSVSSSNSNLTVKRYEYDEAEQTATLWLKAHDIQGETGEITLEH